MSTQCDHGQTSCLRFTVNIIYRLESKRRLVNGEKMLVEREPAMKTMPIDDDVIVTNLALCKCFALNGSASMVWNCLESPRSVEQICAVLREHFDIAAEDCRIEIEALICKWRELGLVRDVS